MIHGAFNEAELQTDPGRCELLVARRSTESEVFGIFQLLGIVSVQVSHPP